MAGGMAFVCVRFLVSFRCQMFRLYILCFLDVDVGGIRVGPVCLTCLSVEGRGRNFGLCVLLSLMVCIRRVVFPA